MDTIPSFPFHARLPIVLLVALASAAPAASDPSVADATDRDALYAIGALLGRQLSDLALSPEELDVVVGGLRDAARGDPLRIDPAAHRGDAAALRRRRNEAATARERDASRAYLAEERQRDGVVATASGLLYEERVAGTGASPSATDTVEVHYHGTLRDGTVFDSSVDRGAPARFVLSRVVPCWREGLQRMKVGGRARLVCPPELAYGDRGFPPRIPAGAALVFDLELREIVGAPAR